MALLAHQVLPPVLRGPVVVALLHLVGAAAGEVPLVGLGQLLVGGKEINALSVIGLRSAVESPTRGTS